jgi:glycosyltransferase involved in cell wall biosynthesis
MAGISLRSFLTTIEAARSAGMHIEPLVMLDNPDEATRLVFGGTDHLKIEIIEVDLRDQGKVRNYAIQHSKGRAIAFLDGDDLWSENWLIEAHRLRSASEDPDRVIAHPEANWFFESNCNVFFHADQQDVDFDPRMLRFVNYWDALCLAPRSAYLDHPFCERDVAGGFAYEDWHWNCETLNAGYIHRVVPDTLHFKRRRADSQTVQASSKKCLTPMTPMALYAWTPPS